MGLSGPPNVEKMKAKKDVKGLIKALGYQQDSKIRMSAAVALGDIGDARAVEPLIAARKDTKWDVRLAAAKALGQIGDARALDSLIGELNDNYEDVRLAAAKALVEIGAPAVEPLTAALKDGNVRSAAAKALVEIGAPAVEPLTAALKDENKYVRWAAAKALVKLRWQPAVEPLIAALKDKDANVRYQAAEILGLFGETRAIEPLIVLLKNADRGMQTAAARSLVQIYDSDKIAPNEKKLILAQRRLIAHTDYGGHLDQPAVCSFPHEDIGGIHTDAGIRGVYFPL